MSLEVFMQVRCLQKSKWRWNKVKQGRKNQDSAIFAQHFLLCEIFAQHIPCANLLLCQFSKMYALCPFPKISVRISQECEPCANLFLWQNFKIMLSILENHRNAKFSHNTRTTLAQHPPCANFLASSSLPPQSQASEPHFFAPLCLRPEEAMS